MGDRSLAPEDDETDARDSRTSTSPSQAPPPSRRSGTRRRRRAMVTGRERRRKRLQREIAFWVLGMLAVAVATVVGLWLIERGP